MMVGGECDWEACRDVPRLCREMLVAEDVVRAGWRVILEQVLRADESR